MRWKYCLLLAMLLLLPVRTSTKEDEEDGEPNEEEEDDDSNDDDDEEEEQVVEKPSPGRRAPPVMLQTTKTVPVTRTPKKRPLECYVCAYKSDTPLRACLDPTKYRVNTMTCHSVEEKCFTSVVAKGSSYEAVIRGCRTGCLGSPDITCCDLNRCNNQPFALPTVIVPRSLSEENKATKTIPSVMFFITILLLLQTVVKVTIA